MPHMIEMPDGEYITPFCFVDALDAVEEYAGRELREFIEEYMQDNVDAAGEARLEAEETRRDSEMSADYYHEQMLAIEDGLEMLAAKLYARRVDRTATQKMVKALIQMVQENL